MAACSSCGRPLHIRKTTRWTLHTLSAGILAFTETVGFCPDHPVACRSSLPAILAPPRCRYAYDVLLKTALLRFQDGFSLPFIQHAYADLLTPPLRTLAHLSRVGLGYLWALHQQAIPALRNHFLAQGGWILHLDGTNEEGTPTLLIAVEGTSGILLGAWLLPSESADAVVPILRELESLFGPPAVVVRDLHEGLREAITTVWPTVPQQDCQFHLVKALLRRAFTASHRAMRAEFRRLGVVTRLHAVVKDLPPLAEEDWPYVDRVRQALRDGLPLPAAPRSRLVPLLVRAVVAEVAEGASRGSISVGGFPFRLPYLERYERCCWARTVVRGMSRALARDLQADPVLARLVAILDTVGGEGAAGRELRRWGEETRWLRDRGVQYRALLRGYREIRRTEGTSGNGTEELERRLDGLSEQLLREVRSLSAGDYRRTRLESMVALLEERRPYVHVADPEVRTAAGETRVLPLRRTNVVACEQRLWRISRPLRRARVHGRLRESLWSYGPGVAVLSNLVLPLYQELAYGSSAEVLGRMRGVQRAEVTEILRRWDRSWRALLVSPLPRGANRPFAEAGARLLETGPVGA